MRRPLRMTATALLGMLLLISTLAAGTAPAQASGSCNPNTVWGICLHTLPRLYCCSGGFLGWSGIYVGDSFSLSGKLSAGDPSTPVLTLHYPSGRQVAIPLQPDGAFRSVVKFDEEGRYQLTRGSAGWAAEFYVAYRAQAVDNTPTLSDLFGGQHWLFGNLALMTPTQGRTVRVQFTDAAGQPARNQTLHTKFGDQPITTDAEGIADLRVEPAKEQVPYPTYRVYPGLVVQTFREIALGEDGSLPGLPGGDLQGVQVDGQWYFGLREFLTKADPYTFPPDRPELIQWDGDTRTVLFHNLTLMVDNGEVIGGRTSFRVHPVNREGRWMLPLADLARLFDEIGYANLSTNGILRIASPFIP